MRSRSPATIEAFAPAKVNLTLHVTGQRADGYHLLDSLVVFAAVGDRIRVHLGQVIDGCLEGVESRDRIDDPDFLPTRVTLRLPRAGMQEE